MACVILSCGMAVAQNIFVVRHAEKISETADELSAMGKERAACLANTLKDAPVVEAIASPTERAKSTAKPTADQNKVEVKSMKADDYSSIAAEAKKQTAMGNVLIVGHSNTVPQIVKALTGKDVTVGSAEYDKLFVIEGDHVVTLHYCPTRAAEPESRMK